MCDGKVLGEILRLLKENPGGVISGEEISGSVGFSRANVWKYINKLRADGYKIRANTRVGYSLEALPKKIPGYEVPGIVKTEKFGKEKVYFYDSVDSTNIVAYGLAEKGAPEGSLVIAEEQTAGRGRLGRKWISPSGAGIYMSIILRPDADMERIPGITLVSAVSLTKAIKMSCGIDAGIKWPNDIFIKGRKVAGILTEMKAHPEKIDFIITGIGVNMEGGGHYIPEGGISLSEACAGEVDRRKVLKCLLENLEEDYNAFVRDGFVSLRERCISASIVLDKKVNVKQNNTVISGDAVDIDYRGALVVRQPNGEVKTILSGDVELCRIER